MEVRVLSRAQKYMENKTYGHRLKIYVTVTMILLLPLGLGFVISSSNKKNNEDPNMTIVLGTSGGIDLLVKKAILQNDIGICERIEISSFDMIGNTKEETTDFCKSRFEIAQAEKTIREIEYTYWNMGEKVIYPTPYTWTVWPSHNDTLCFGEGCPKFTKIFAGRLGEDEFLYFYDKGEGFNENSITKYVSDNFGAVNPEVITNVVSENFPNKHLLYIVGDMKKEAHFIFIAQGTLFDLKYVYRPVVYSQFDKERIIRMIGSIIMTSEM